MHWVLLEFTGCLSAPHANKATYTNLAVGSLVGGYQVAEKVTVYMLRRPGVTTGRPESTYTDSQLAQLNWTIGS